MLSINDFRKQDEGSYSCEVETLGGKEKSASILMKCPRFVPSVSLSLIFNEKNHSLLLCTEIVSNLKTKAPKWMKDGKQICLNKQPQKYLESRHPMTKPSLTIFDVGKADEGMYTVSIENEYGPGISETKVFRIPKDPPKLLLSFVHNIHEKCFTVVAEIDSKVASPDIKMKKVATNIHLYVNDVTQDDEGVYRAVVENRAGTNSSQAITFNFSGENPKVSLTQTAEKHTVELNGLIESSWPIKKRIWQRDGLNLPKLPGKYDVTETKLRINKITKQDEGLYRLCVQSTAGIGKSKQIRISIETEPGSSTYNRNSNQSTPRNEALTKSITKMEQETVQAVQSSLVKIHRPYTHRVKCEICNKTAIATFENCKDSYCLECLQCVAGTCTTSTIKCPKAGDCSSYITVETFARFLKIPYTLNIE
ncbi:titin-like, partial [Saccostrea cucullata]|uniref:titin-like n=1 Tax=Saccostrea cuccullata TaxID=36930 RepID=UPI002ED525A5